MRKPNRPSPNIVEFEITLNCPLRCIHCYSRAGESNVQPSTDEVKDILEQLRRLGTRYVDIVGGEPLIRRDIVEILGYAREIGQDIMVNTNGVLLTPELAKDIRKANPRALFGVSIDGARTDTNDRIRGKGSFEKAVNAIEILKSEGFRVVSLFVVNAVNWREFEEYVRFVMGLGVDGVYVDRFVPVGRGADNAGVLDMEVKDWVKALRYVGEIVRRYGNKTHFYVEESVSGSRCSAGITHASILADLNVVPCGHFRYHPHFIMGNLREKSFEEIWRDYPGIGRGCIGCPAYALAKTGNLCADEVVLRLIEEKRSEREAMA